MLSSAPASARSFDLAKRFSALPTYECARTCIDKKGNHISLIIKDQTNLTS
jgi:hypothetical protein